MNQAVALLSLAACCAATPTKHETLPELIASAKESVVRVLTYQKGGVGVGAGYAISKSGHIVTAAHVVQGAKMVEVVLSNEATYVATVLLQDPVGDIAVLRIDSLTKPVEFADSDAIEPGDSVFAIGHPLGLFYSVSSGIVSAKYRYINLGVTGDFIQLNLATNPGNSGGPVFDNHGRVIGMVTFSVVSPRGPSGYGLAVPSNRIKLAVARCIESRICN